MSMGKTIMIQGTASHVGKSITVAALCRIFHRRGFRVAPFKAQNMANNSFVTQEGGEIGRAQAMQAMAAGIEPSVRMNPVLLKPSSDQCAQVIVLGRPTHSLSAQEFYLRKEELLPIVMDALNQLCSEYDIVVIEGAGSPAEINLKKQDIVNMRLAKVLKAPVLLIGDIDRGGVFAQIIGTYELLDSEEKSLIKAFLINKFRGDKAILDPGIIWMEERLKRKCLGVIPWIPDLALDEEDAVALQERDSNGKVALPGHTFFHPSHNDQLLIHVIRLPRISNFTDFDPLQNEPNVCLQYVEHPIRHIRPDLLILPGTKATVSDLRFLQERGWDAYIRQYVDQGGNVFGICGGFQMLGESLHDPDHVESKEPIVSGLGLLPVKTTFHRTKTTKQVKAIHLESGLTVRGYEIHMGETHYTQEVLPLFRIVEQQGQPAETHDGVIMTLSGKEKSSCTVTTSDGERSYPFISGTYIHGLFDEPAFRRYFLNKLRLSAGLKPWIDSKGQAKGRGNGFDTLADIFEQNMDMKLLDSILQGEKICQSRA